MEEKNKPGETVPEPGESERISAERKAALQDIDRKREEKEKLRQTQKQEAVKVHGSLSALYELAAACMYCAFDSKHHYHYD